VADLAFKNDVEALEKVRHFFNYLPANNQEKPPVWPTEDPADRIEMSLDTIIPSDPNKPYDMKEVILKVADEGAFFETQVNYAKNIITGFVRIEGSSVHDLFGFVILLISRYSRLLMFQVLCQEQVKSTAVLLSMALSFFMLMLSVQFQK
jgi:hypothetical protein